MILYKYFPVERIDVLQNLKIRFSQPRIYNDPFELRPVAKSVITLEQFNNIIPILINHHEGPQEAIDLIRKITYSDFLTDPSYILWLIQEVISSGSLALCLTEVPDSLLMWAHYASYHKGFVLGFDVSHDFFTCPTKTYFLKRISYQNERPVVIFPNPNPDDVYFTKSLEWSYEKEWRLFRRLPDGKQPEQFTERDKDNFPVYLFDLPPESIKEVILGCRIKRELGEKIKKIVSDKLTHVAVKHVLLSDKKYELQINQ